MKPALLTNVRFDTRLKTTASTSGAGKPQIKRRIGQGTSAMDPAPSTLTSFQTSGSVWVAKSSSPSLTPSPSVSARVGSVP